MAIKIDYTDKKEQRKFGLLVGAVFIIIGAIRWAIHGFVGIPYISVSYTHLTLPTIYSV